MRVKRLFFNLHFNLQSEEFAYYKKITMQGRAEWVPVTEFFKEGIATFFGKRNEESDDLPRQLREDTAI